MILSLRLGCVLCHFCVAVFWSFTNYTSLSWIHLEQPASHEIHLVARSPREVHSSCYDGPLPVLLLNTWPWTKMLGKQNSSALWSGDLVSSLFLLWAQEWKFHLSGLQFPESYKNRLKPFPLQPCSLPQSSYPFSSCHRTQTMWFHLHDSVTGDTGFYCLVKL